MQPMPLGIPLSFCLPSECNSSTYIQPTLDKAQDDINKILNNAKKSIDFDNLYDALP